MQNTLFLGLSFASLYILHKLLDFLRAVRSIQFVVLLRLWGILTSIYQESPWLSNLTITDRHTFPPGTRYPGDRSRNALHVREQTSRSAFTPNPRDNHGDLTVSSKFTNFMAVISMPRYKPWLFSHRHREAEQSIGSCFPQYSCHAWCCRCFRNKGQCFSMYGVEV